MYLIKNLIAITETTNATIIPVNNIATSAPVKSNPNLINFIKLAPNIIGIDIKNEYSAAIGLDPPKIMPPNIVAPERDVPGIKDNV